MADYRQEELNLAANRFKQISDRCKFAMDITDEELAELRESLELQEFYVPKNDPEHVRGMDSLFHRLIYRFSGNTALCDALLPLHKKVMKYR